MKRIAVTSVLLLVFTIFNFAQDNRSNQMEIQKLENLSKNVLDYRIFYNLGIYYANEKEMGKAILNLKKSYLMKPADIETKANLDNLRSALGTPPYLIELSPLEKALMIPFNLLDINVTFIFSIILILIGCTGLSLILLKFIPLLWVKYVKYLRTGSIILILIGFIYFFSCYIRYSIIFDDKNAVIIMNSDLLERPAPDSIKLSDVVSGIECTIKKENNGFYLINTIDGREGWVEESGVERLWEKK